MNAQEHPFDTAGLTTRFFLTGSPDISPSEDPQASRVPRVSERNFAPLGGLILALFVAACFWGGVYELAKWLVKVL